VNAETKILLLVIHPDNSRYTLWLGIMKW
jgi:hypothetical protein